MTRGESFPFGAHLVDKLGKAARNFDSKCDQPVRAWNIMIVVVFLFVPSLPFPSLPVAHSAHPIFTPRVWYSGHQIMRP